MVRVGWVMMEVQDGGALSRSRFFSCNRLEMKEVVCG